MGFDRALKETRALLRFHKARSQRVKQEHDRTSKIRSEMRQKQPQQMGKLESTLSSKFMQRHQELLSLLNGMQKENSLMSKLMEDHAETTKTWFPQFDMYKEC